ncbi:MAG: pyridoxal-phosphate dependent enzyme [Anaerolineae bacterium]|nr:pyridoxal-phosphate dependent enzyme [Anaerolineae bacterium]NIN98543.1 pyridoxal-phosphate dependent enzyme [Anaerolineae bacterium]NIQ81439.1 pyridoxal-phosphate dependent enzyme [Anaerolineae bacterium]
MLGLRDILVARRNLGSLVTKTPLHYSFLLSQKVGSEVHLKLENLQRTGAFKVRGAINKIASLSEEERVRGVVAPSSGNFALGVAYAARALGGVPVNLFMPVNTPASKVDKLAEFGAEVFLVGEQYDDADDASREFQQEHDLIYTDSFDDPFIIAGQGTVGLEIMEELPDAEALLVPIGGGGLIAGVSIAAKAVNPRIKIIGVQVEASPSAYLSLKEGRCYQRYEYDPTICEGLAGGFGIVPFQIARDLIDEVVLVNEEEVREAIFVLLETEHLVVEGSGAVGVAALLFDKVNLKDKKVVAVISGGNIDVDLLFEILREHLPRE